MKNTRIIAFDIDGCITDHRVMGDIIKRLYPDFIYDKHMTCYNAQESLLEHGFIDSIDNDFVKKMYKEVICATGDINTPLTKGFIEFYDSLDANDKFEVKILSARKNNVSDLTLTKKLLETNNIDFNHDNIHHVNDAENKQKFLEDNDIKVLFEDNVTTAIKFALASEENTCYLIETPYNRNVEVPKGVVRIKDFTGFSATKWKLG